MKTIEITKCPKCNNTDLENNSKSFYLCRCGHIFKKERKISNNSIKEEIIRCLKLYGIPDNMDIRCMKLGKHMAQFGKDQKAYLEQNQ
jgi:hypothetical protein